MRYIHQTGYDAIIALESETCLQQLHQQFASLGSTPTAVTLRHGTKTADVTVQPGDTLRALLEQLSWQTDDLKAVHIGYPVGGLFTAQVLDKPLTAALLEQAGPADMAVLPEMFCCPYDNSCFRAYGEAPGGEAYQFLSALAREKRLWLVGGSVPELTDGKVYNTSYVFDPSGRCAARHRKLHLFDIDVPGGQSFRESATLSPGSEVTVFDTPWGKMGLCICFDFRFPELAHLMALSD